MNEQVDYCAKLNKVFVRCIFAIFILAFALIVVRFWVKNILYEKMHIDNSIVQVILNGDEDITNANWDGVGEENSAGWRETYPFDENADDAMIKGNNSTEEAIDILSPVKAGLKYPEIIDKLSTTADYYSGKGFILYNNMLEIGSRLERLVGWNASFITAENQVIYMNNGYLVSACEKVNEEDIDYAAEIVSNFAKHCEYKDVPFIYINAGTKVNPEDKQIEWTQLEQSNENADRLLISLGEMGVNTVDLRKTLLVSEREWYDSYYITDHHWNNATALWAADQVAQILSSKCNFDYDDYFLSTKAYYAETYPDMYVGSCGRRVTLANCEPEEYQLYIPQYDTYYSFEVPTANIYREGNYEEVFVDRELLERVKSYNNIDYLTRPDAYTVCRAENYSLAVMRNNAATLNADKKILYIMDSYSSYLMTYLISEVGEICYLYPKSFDGSITKYVDAYKPDVVVMLLNSANIDAIDDTHTSALDLR